MNDNPQSVADVLEGIEDIAEERREVCIGNLLDTYGNRSFGPLIIMLALLELSPLGGIPGVPSFLAFLIGLVALQLVLGREHVWMPKVIERRTVRSRKLIKAVHKLETVADFIDGLSSRRLQWLTQPPFPRVAGAVVVMLCLTVPPLELLPFASSAPMLAIAIVGLALITRDGLFMLIAFVATVAALGVGTWMYLSPG